MPEIGITVSDRVARPDVRDVWAVCGNSDYTITWTLDAEWSAAHIRTAVFVWRDRYTNHNVPVIFEGTSCPMPAIPDALVCAVGLWASVGEGEDHILRTTSPAMITMRRSSTADTDRPIITQDVYDELLAAVNAALDAPVQAATEQAEIAAGHAEDATNSASAAAGSATAAAESAASASASKTAAAGSASAAHTDSAAAIAAKNAAETAQGIAEEARDTAVSAKNAAETAQRKAETAQGKAETAKTAAEAAAQSASGSASSASASATAAGSSATSAAGSASAAHTDAAAALEAKNTAVSAKDTAVAAKDTAVASKIAAEAAQGAAETAATNASGSATAAAGSATAAAASAATAAEVEAQAEEVAASIPEEYSELSGDVADLKSAIYTQNTLAGWEKGVYRSDDGTNYANESYIRCPENYISAAYGTSAITADTGYNFIIYAWDLSGTYIGSYHDGGTFTPTTGAASVTSFDCRDFPNYKFKVAMARDPASTSIAPDEGIHLKCVDSTDKTLSIEGKAADAKAAGNEINAVKSAIVDNYIDKNVDGQTLLIDKSAAKLGVKDLTANLPYSANGYTGINLRHMGARLYVKYGDGINIDRDTGGVKSSTGYQIVGPIDVRNADTLYVNYHHGGGGYQVTAAGYSGTGFESFVGFIYKGNNTQGTADVSYTWNVSAYNYVYFSCRNSETYMRVSTYRTNDGVQFTDGGETLTIYGGTYDYTTGLLTSLYAADGTELETPVTYQLEPMDIPLIDGINEFMTTPSTNGYLFVGTLSGVYLVSAIPGIETELNTATENIATLTATTAMLTATSADLQADVVPFPDYYTEQINANIPAVRLNMKNVGMDGFTFFFITDSHWKQNSKNSPKLIQRIGKTLSIETILHGGDIVQDSATTTNYLQGTDTMRQLKRTGKVFAALGNHDFDAKDPDGTTVVLTADQASGLMQQQEAYWMRKYADGHYYADVDGYRTRVIVLNTGDHNHHGTMQSRELDAEQRAFLNDALDTVPTGWHIIVLQHIWRQDSVTVFATAVAQILDAYNADESSPGKVEAVFCGHKHTDYNTTTPGGIPVIESTCDRRKSDAEQGTTDEGAFDTVTIDYANSVIYLVRTGRGESRTISYGT